MVQIEVEYEGGLRTRATHGPSSATLLTDAPVDNHGKGESFSPTDLVATALGTCMLTIMGIVAERHGWSFVGARASVEKKMVTEPVRKIGALEVVISVPGELEPAARTALEKAALACPVHKTLGSNVDMPVRFEWGAPVA
ncbi:MAG: OsmC family protein [bacterium]|nr:OsmC family protein [bacterium]